MMSPSRLAGALLFIGAAEFLTGMIVAESVFPNYSVSNNYISDLGAYCPTSTTCKIEPSAPIFNGSAVFFGILVLVSAALIWRAYRSKAFTPVVALAGIGVLGVGLFPETTGIWHGIFSLIAFFFAGLSAVVAYKFEKAPYSLLSVIVGGIILVALGLYVGGQYAGLGPGGMERMIVYPALIFTLGFGGHIMASPQETPNKLPGKFVPR